MSQAIEAMRQQWAEMEKFYHSREVGHPELTTKAGPVDLSVVRILYNAIIDQAYDIERLKEEIATLKGTGGASTGQIWPK